ncbi:MAG TPA: nucleotidyltransferase family protein [Bryobacteraceae bacterium]|nr:nucleotidyltransferase family protein [Bryobacteraceae bacterium]
MADSNPLDQLLIVLKTPEHAAEFASQPAVWEEIKRLAEVHRFTAQLAYSTSAWLPPSERAWRDQTLMTHHRRHAQRLETLRQLLEAFAEAGIACVSLKGPLLAERFYEQPFLRPARDLDLLIHEHEVGRAARLMMKLGYRLHGSYPWPMHRDIDKHLDFRIRENVPGVEVHFQAEGANGVFMTAGEFMDRACLWKSPSGFEAKVLAPADEAFHSALHAATHAFHRLRWLYDTMRIARTLTDTERAFVRQLAERFSETGRLVAVAIAAQDYFGEPLALDIAGFSVPWLWSRLSTRHTRKMTSRVEGNTSTLAEKIGCRFDLCRMAGTPLAAAKLLGIGVNVELRKKWYSLRNPIDAGTLARTLPE